MARINSMGFDELLNAIEHEIKITPDMMEKMLDAAADEYVKETRRQIDRYGVFDKGATWWSIKKRMVGKRRDGFRMEVWPAGTRVDDKHPSGERVETVAFVNEYGTTKQKPRPFMENAALVAETPALEAMYEVAKRESKL